MDAEEAGDIGCRSTGGKHGDDLGLLLRGELGLTAATASLGTRRAQASLGSFAHHGALEFGKRPQHRSEEHTSELQSLMRISYAVFCLKKKKKNNNEQKI